MSNTSLTTAVAATFIKQRFSLSPESLAAKTNFRLYSASAKLSWIALISAMALLICSVKTANGLALGACPPPGTVPPVSTLNKSNGLVPCVWPPPGTVPPVRALTRS
eukprot:CAMPEP_0172881324 /NCGR_PEP_ID=MMETSP1075-20121228/117213_1 /TAXON_ID=2916 /ORGANISM="Ceratium fusus, Strain PA161109" /LENGTH=106 /DNA_ID=CAMNT_0013733753 /DNA_START=25 /DNA_END=345 /DNA_ORIENTATION=-